MKQHDAEASPPPTLFWRGIRFQQQRAEREELLRYEAEPGSHQGALLWQWPNGQWGAKFRGGSYSVARTSEEALVQAVVLCIRMKAYDIQCLEALLLGSGYE